MSQNTQVPCPRCKGKGVTDLDPVTQATLDALGPNPSTSFAVHDRMVARGFKCTPSATMNRLAKLIFLELVTRTSKDGRNWIYQRVEPNSDTSQGILT